MSRVRVEFEKEEIQKIIANVFKPEHKALMSECILSLLKNDETSLETLAKAAMGIEPMPQYFIGDDVIIRANSLSSWRFDEEAMVEVGLIQNGNMKCRIDVVDKFAYEQYTVKYNYIDKDDVDKKQKEYTSKVSERDISNLADELPF